MTDSDVFTRIAEAGTTVLSEAGAFVTEHTETVQLGQTEGTRTLRIELDTSFDTTDMLPAVEDTFSIYLVDRATRRPRC